MIHAAVIIVDILHMLTLKKEQTFMMDAVAILMKMMAMMQLKVLLDKYYVISKIDLFITWFFIYYT